MFQFGRFMYVFQYSLMAAFADNIVFATVLFTIVMIVRGDLWAAPLIIVGGVILNRVFRPWKGRSFRPVPPRH